MLEHRVSGKMRVFTGGKKYDSLSHDIMVSLTGKICVLYCWGGESTRGGTNRGPRAWLACLRDRGGMIRLLQLLTIMIGPIARGVHHARLSLSLSAAVYDAVQLVHAARYGKQFTSFANKTRVRGSRAMHAHRSAGFGRLARHLG